MTSFIEIAQIFTGRATDIDDIITNIAGTLVGYLIAYWFTGIFTRNHKVIFDYLFKSSYMPV